MQTLPFLYDVASTGCLRNLPKENGNDTPIIYRLGHALYS